MTRLSRWMLAALAAVLLLALPTAQATPPSQPWAQTGSDLPADPSVRFGTLPNGMRYAIKRNTTPKGAVSLRFRFDVGSLMERDNEQGIAHVLEHMAFRGSAHVADGDMVKKLQSLGLTFGADTNAFTESTQTVYSFDMPKNDEASLDTSLMLMREIAGNLNIAQDTLNAERNVVLAEARLRDVPSSHLQKSDFTFLYGARAASALRPIGLESVVAHADSKLLRDFYRAWYRPERATLIIAGDIDPAGIEAKIKAQFSDWQNKSPKRPVPVFKPLAKHPAAIAAFSEAGAPAYAIFNWLRPYDTSPDTRTNEARDVTRFIALGIFNQRLSVLSHGTTPPFTYASASHDHVARVAEATQLEVYYHKGDLADALKAVDVARRQVLAHGVRQDEIDQAVAQLRTLLQSNLAAADTTPTPQIVTALLRSVDDRDVFTAPATDLAMFDDIAKTITAAKIEQSLAFIFGGDGPLTFVSAPEPVTGGSAAIAATLKQAAATPLPQEDAGGLPAWPYADFGKPGAIAEQRTVDEFGVTYVRFANGVTLTIKPTQFHAGQILVDVRLGSGRLGLPHDRISSVWALGSTMTQGGLARYSYDDLQRFLAGKLCSVSLVAADDAFLLTGQTRQSDLDTEMQLLTAYATDAAWPQPAFDQVRQSYALSVEQSNASPMGVLGREFNSLIHGGDPRWATPTPDAIGKASLDDTKALILPALQSGPVEITVVGDTSVDAVVKSVAATWGALPPRPRGAQPHGDETFPAPAKEPVVLIHHGAPNQAVAMMVWPTTGFLPDMKLQRTLRVVAQIFSQRLLDELRTREGITYSPGATTVASLYSPGYGYLYALAQIPPDKIPNFYSAVHDVEEALATTPVGDDELDRAKGPRVEDILRQQQTNEYWLSLLAGSQTNPALLDIVRSTIPDIKAVSAEDVQRAAKDWLKDDKAYRLVVEPGQ